MNVNWEQAPPWAEWWACAANGESFWFSTEPHPVQDERGVWGYRYGRCQPAEQLPPPADWRSAKAYRPGPDAKAGTLLRIESGEYSDYQVSGFFLVLKDFNPKDDVVARVESARGKLGQDHSRATSEGAMLAEWVRKGYLQELEHGVIWFGDMSIKDMSFTPTEVNLGAVLRFGGGSTFGELP